MIKERIFISLVGLLSNANLIAQSAPTRSKNGNTLSYTIIQPRVDQKETAYPKIKIDPGDTLTFEASGCVQTQGVGDTWKDIVYPIPASDNLYFGGVKIQDVVTDRFSNILNKEFIVPTSAKNLLFYFTYKDEDDKYEDNSYDDHDNGVQDQCRPPVGNAVIKINVKKNVMPLKYQKPIDSILFADPPIGGALSSSPNWASDVVKGKRFLKDLFETPWEWTPVMSNPYNKELEPPFKIQVLNGYVATESESGADLPFTHPFGLRDWEIMLLADPAYQKVAGQSNFMQGAKEPEIQEAFEHAQTEYQLSGKTMGCVEIDKDLVPTEQSENSVEFRPQEINRVAVWGRWIVDAGHPDFHTEIHPPLMMVRAEVDTIDNTHATIWGRPFMVSQQFKGDAFLLRAVKELGNVMCGQSLLMEAKSELVSKDFESQRMKFILRPPKKRQHRGDLLSMTYRLLVRDGINVKISKPNQENDAVQFTVEFNSDAYQQPAPIGKDGPNFSFGDIAYINPEASDYLTVIQLLVDANAALPLLNLTSFGCIPGSGTLASFLVRRGIASRQFSVGRIPDLRTEVNPTLINVKSLSSTPTSANISVKNDQAFPIMGEIRLKWIRFQAPGREDVR